MLKAHAQELLDSVLKHPDLTVNKINVSAGPGRPGGEQEGRALGRARGRGAAGLDRGGQCKGSTGGGP